MPPSPAKTGAERRRASERAGRRAETLAAWLLRAKRYRIVAMRYKTKIGEIDLIARRGKTMVFVEVKRRSSSQRLGEALEAVNTARITRAAQWYISAHPHLAGFDFRFDVITLAPGRWPHHLVNAFPAAR